MINSELINYVKQSLRQNIGEQDIRDTLLASGWAQTDINDAISTVRSLQTVNASAGIISNYSDNGNGAATLQSGSQMAQEPIIGMVKGLESGASQFWTSAPKHYAAVFTPERIIFINIKNSAASSVFNGLVGGMVGSMVNSLDEQFKTEELMSEISAKGIDNILSEHPDAMVVSKNDLAGATYKEGSRLWKQKGKIALAIGGATRNFYAPAEGFKQFQSLANNLLSGNFQPVQFAPAGNLSAMPNASNPGTGGAANSGRNKTITTIIAVVFIFISAFFVIIGIGDLVQGGEQGIVLSMSSFIYGVIILIFGVLILKMRRWALYISIFFLVSAIAGFSDLGEDASGQLPTTADLIIVWIWAGIVAATTAYLWSIRRVLR